MLQPFLLLSSRPSNPVPCRYVQSPIQKKMEQSAEFVRRTWTSEPFLGPGGCSATCLLPFFVGFCCGQSSPPWLWLGFHLAPLLLPLLMCTRCASQASQAMDYEGVSNTLHAYYAHETLALQAMNAPLVKLRQRFDHFAWPRAPFGH